MHGCADVAAKTACVRRLGSADVGGRGAGCHVPAICKSGVGLQPQLLHLGARDVADRGDCALDRAGDRRHSARLDPTTACGDHLVRGQCACARSDAGVVRGGCAQGYYRAPPISCAGGRSQMTTSVAGNGSLLRVDGLSKTFGGFVALENISVEIRKGERFGLIGPNGSGKTTLVNCISGALRPNKGAVVFGGEDITRLPPNMRARRGIARSFQIPRPFRSMTVAENLMVALDFAAGHSGSLRERQEAALSILTKMGLAPKARALTSTLSQVELRKMELARAMAMGPKLLISDEAMAGLSSSEVDEVLDLLLSLGGDDIAIIMIEHIMQAVMRFSERVMCLDAGRIIAIGSPSEVMANPRVQEAYLGT